MTERAFKAGCPSFAGRNIAVVHPAWHSCGTYRVVIGQIAAYRALGANVFPLAVSTDPGYVPERNWIWRSFLKATPELDRGERYLGGPTFTSFVTPGFLRNVLWPYLHGDQAIIRAGAAACARLPHKLRRREFDLIHCNHFFLMPVAQKLARGGAPIILDTHDLQARQFMLMNEHSFSLRPATSYDALLAQEMALLSNAQLLIHLNRTEEEEFRALLPGKAHTLLYPAVPDVPTGPGGAEYHSSC